MFLDPTLARVGISFDKLLQVWDGFGVNYVQACKTRDFDADPQDYGGFSTLSINKRASIMQMVFGDDGLKPGLIKIFQDPFQLPDDYAPRAADAPIDMSAYDHERASFWVRAFAREGLRITRERGGDLQMLMCQYGPPACLTDQRCVKGRDISEPERETENLKYMAAWAKFLREREGLPINYISLHNEGEKWTNWREDGVPEPVGGDYIHYWSPERVTRSVSMLRDILDKNGLREVGVTPGETSNWFRLHAWGYAGALKDDEAAMNALGLITSHGFYALSLQNKWFSDWRSAGIDMLREVKPSLKAWVTSSTWGKMGADIAADVYGHIYSAKVNGLIPWAFIQSTDIWQNDPNAGCAFRVENGDFTVQPGYYFYKQLTTAGQPGKRVARVFSMDSEVCAIAFAGAGTGEPNAFVINNISNDEKRVRIELSGASSGLFTGTRSSASERYQTIDELRADSSGRACLVLPPASTSTYMEVRDQARVEK